MLLRPAQSCVCVCVAPDARSAESAGVQGAVNGGEVPGGPAGGQGSGAGDQAGVWEDSGQAPGGMGYSRLGLCWHGEVVWTVFSNASFQTKKVKYLPIK